MSRASGNCWLYHGPRASVTAEAVAREKGRLIGSYGKEGFDIEVSRKVVDIMRSTPVGDRMATLVAGPLDEARMDSLDPLLKAIEEFDGDLIQPYLWALDIGGVRRTILSRCFVQWCPGDYPIGTDMVDLMERVCLASMQGDVAVVASCLQGIKDRDVEALQAAALVLSKKTDPRYMTLWESVRELPWRKCSMNEIVDAFLLPDAP